MAISITNRLLAGVLLFWSPVVSSVQNRTDVTTTTEFGKLCNKSEQCSSLGPEFWCHPDYHNCTCRGGLLWIVNLHRCAEAVSLKEECEASEQCIAYDRHSYCGEFGRSQLPPKICQCQFGFNMKSHDKQTRCIEIPNAFGTPLFDSRDTVPIVMGCLAAGLALVACCAGIVQLLRIKQRSGPFRTGEPQDPRESVMLNLNQMLQPYSDIIPFRVPPCNGGWSCLPELQKIKQRSGPFRTGEPQDPRESVMLNLNQMLQPYSDIIPFRVPPCNGSSTVPFSGGFYQTTTGAIEWKEEKEVLTLKTTENISYREAKKRFSFLSKVGYAEVVRRGPARPVMASAGTQTPPEGVCLPSVSPLKPMGAVPAALHPNHTVDAVPSTSTLKQGMAPPAASATLFPRGRGQPCVSTPQKPSEPLRLPTPAGLPPAPPEEPMDKGGPESGKESPSAGSDSSLSATSDSTGQQKEAVKKKNAPRKKN
ncbi:uncharacterized protein ISCGN_001906 [Ixodes scapularis]